MVAREKLTSAQAKTFDRISVANATLVAMNLKCGCEPYQDVFTYGRWQAQGYQVQKGERAISLPLIKNVLKKDEDTEEAVPVRILGRSWVFCRHQVRPCNGS